MWLLLIAFFVLVSLVIGTAIALVRYSRGRHARFAAMLVPIFLSVIAFAICMALVALFTLLGTLMAILTNQEAVQRWLSSPVAIPFIFAASIGLFWLRCRQLLVYGCLELVASIGTITYAVNLPSASLLAKVVGILGGAYIMVRGLDNLDKVLKGKSRRWTSFFWNQREGAN